MPRHTSSALTHTRVQMRKGNKAEYKNLRDLGLIRLQAGQTPTDTASSLLGIIGARRP